MGTWGYAPWDSDGAADRAIEQMKKVLLFQEGTLATAVTQELALLESRRKNAKGRPVLEKPESWGNFWS